MTFFQFASYNVRRNKRAYAAYFFSSAFAIMMFFLYATLANHPNLQQGALKQIVVLAMNIGEYIIFGFAFFSILYSMGSFLKGRTREFGVLTLLGMSGRQFVWMVFLENMLLGLSAMLAGIAVGLLGSKLFLMLGSAVFEIGSLSFYLPVQALLITLGAFTLLFLLVSLATTLFIRNNTVLSLLKGVKRPKAEPKASIWLALFAAVCLIGGYAYALTYNGISSSSMLPLIVIVLVAIGTYFLYTQLSVMIIRGLKKRRVFYWRGTHLLWLSDLTYSMKDNARLFFVIAMILSVSFTATSALAMFKSLSTTPSIPFAFSLTFEDGKNTAVAPLETLVRKTLHDQHFSYTSAQASYASIPLKGGNKYGETFMSVSDYNQLARALHVATVTVRAGQAIELTGSPANYKYDAPLTNGSTITLAQQPQAKMQVVNGGTQQVFNDENTSYLLIVSDQAYQAYTKGIQQVFYVGYNVANWKDTLNVGFDLQNQVYRIYEQYNPSAPNDFYIESHAFIYFSANQLPDIMMFIGLFVALIFLIASSSFLYFRLYSSLAENKERYRALLKVGLTLQEMRASITIQVAALFFAPFIMAIVSTAFAMRVAQNNLNAGASVLLPTVYTVGAFLLIQLMYFVIVRLQYLHQLESAISVNA